MVFIEINKKMINFWKYVFVVKSLDETGVFVQQRVDETKFRPVSGHN